MGAWAVAWLLACIVEQPAGYCSGTGCRREVRHSLPVHHTTYTAPEALPALFLARQVQEGKPAQERPLLPPTRLAPAPQSSSPFWQLRPANRSSSEGMPSPTGRPSALMSPQKKLPSGPTEAAGSSPPARWQRCSAEEGASRYVGMHMFRLGRRKWPLTTYDLPPTTHNLPDTCMLQRAAG